MATPEQYISDKIVRLSDKQSEALSIIARGNEDGTYVSLEQLQKRLSHKPDQRAVHFMFRYMLAQKRIEIASKTFAEPNGKRGRPKVNLRLRITELGRHFISVDYGKINSAT
jgi:hypothetical protein